MTVRPGHNKLGKTPAARPVFPFTAVVGQEEMKLALLLNVVSPTVGGVLVRGHRGTGKTTAVRALADLLPPLSSIRGCQYNCDPTDDAEWCDECEAKYAAGSVIKRERRPVPVVELPLGATEDRVCGTIDLGRALKEGVKSFEPGLLARANRGFLYIDEVNLLEDHLVDVLLDVAATGRNRVEREGVSAEHPAHFVLVGSANPEEGELRPQLLDRFGLCVEVETVRDLDSRIRIVENREAFDRDPAAFNSSRQSEQLRLRRRVLRAAEKYPAVKVPRRVLRQIAELCLRLGVDGHRGELTVTRAARALAALEGRNVVTNEDARRVAPLALRHRLRRDPLEHGGGGARVERTAEEIFGSADADSNPADEGSARPSSDTSRRSDMPQRPDASQRSNAADGTQRSDDRIRTNNPRTDNAGKGTDARGSELVMPVAEGGLRQDALTREQDASKLVKRADSSTRRRAGTRSSARVSRGRYSGASASKRDSSSLALDATLRAAAWMSAAGAATNPQQAFRVAPEALRFKRFRGREGALFIFLVDTSGSMAANRIAQAKGALAQLLRRSYVNRDRVALVTFRASGAELLLAPSASPARARALLDALPVGGATPLAAGLLRTLEVARRAAAHGARQLRLVVFTDGRANVPLAGKAQTDGAALRSNGVSPDADKVSPADKAALKEQIRDEVRALGASLLKEGVASLVIDTQAQYTDGGEGRLLSDALGGRYLRLPQVFDEGAFVS
ncbi:MAG TPA: magnesium chelatase ATPase subunit I [Pyrinomonadaceae bacterium]|nr:magnesium chelatase ATPase subunit I [Pyrinomonadaceae bacterium]